MATNLELRQLFGNNTLKNKVEAACLIAAEAIRNEDDQTANHANRLLWAKRASRDTVATGKEMLKMLLAARKDLSAAEIEGASDDAINNSVAAAVDLFADGS